LAVAVADQRQVGSREAFFQLRFEMNSAWLVEVV
jgi:hypothetical protein